VESKRREDELRISLNAVETEIVVLRSTSQHDREVIDRLQSDISKHDISQHDREMIARLQSELDDTRSSLARLQVDYCAVKKDKEKFEELSKYLEKTSKSNFNV